LCSPRERDFYSVAATTGLGQVNMKFEETIEPARNPRQTDFDSAVATWAEMYGQ
jgi:hypothetical protein